MSSGFLALLLHWNCFEFLFPFDIVRLVMLASYARCQYLCTNRTAMMSL